MEVLAYDSYFEGMVFPYVKSLLLAMGLLKNSWVFWWEI